MGGCDCPPPLTVARPAVQARLPDEVGATASTVEEGLHGGPKVRGFFLNVTRHDTQTEGYQRLRCEVMADGDTH